MFVCPICGKPLNASDSGLRCQSGHCYDRAKSGYVNLLPPRGSKEAPPGDNREMVAARMGFLSAGHYAPLAAELSGMLAEAVSCRRFAAVLDAGCGEGYYTAAAQRALSLALTDFSLYATDISKFAVERAAKDSAAHCAVASSYCLPLAGHSLDAVYTVFAPVATKEFFRVLKRDGILLTVTAGRRHLYELKQVAYDAPRENEETPAELAGFLPGEERRLTYSFTAAGKELADLFAMTPYCYRTPEAGKARLTRLDRLTLTADFVLKKYRKKI